MDLSLESRLILYPLSIREDKKNYIVEENVSGDFFEMPKICIDAIQLINQGESLRVIEQQLIIIYPDEDVDLLDFANQLLTLKLVKEIDGQQIQEKKEQSISGFRWIPSQFGRFFFNRVTAKLYTAIFCINLLIFMFHPHYFPHYKDIFLFDSMVFSMLTYMGISLLLIIIHEFGHVLAERSYNLPAKLEVGNRLFFVVFETDLTPGWRLKPCQRNVLFLAGMSFEQLILFAVLLVKLFAGSGSLLMGITGIIIFDILIKTVYQCCFYMKTDLYYMCENITGCYNLMENGKQLLRRWLPFIKADHTTEIFSHEKRTVQFYSVFYVIGVIVTFGLFIIYFLPQALYAYSKILPELMQPIGNPYFWDAIVFVGQTLVMAGLLIYSIVKKRRRSNESLVHNI